MASSCLHPAVKSFEAVAACRWLGGFSLERLAAGTAAVASFRMQVGIPSQEAYSSSWVSFAPTMEWLAPKLSDKVVGGRW